MSNRKETIMKNVLALQQLSLKGKDHPTSTSEEFMACWSSTSLFACA